MDKFIQEIKEQFNDYLSEALASVKDVSVNTNQYMAAHGKKPSGHGNWIIYVGEKEVTFNGMYSLAITKAKRVAKENEVRTIVVAS